jgi:hypothetical protein
MNQAKLQRIVLALVMATGGLSGCASESSSSSVSPTSTTTPSTGPKSGGSSAPVAPVTRAGLIPQRTPPIPDLPVPLGFKMVESTSRSYESAGARYVDHTYAGKADKVDVDAFYRQQMINKGWTMRGSSMVRGVFIQRYEKGTELADVTITGDENPLTGANSTVNINVQTVGRGEPKR